MFQLDNVKRYREKRNISEKLLIIAHWVSNFGHIWSLKVLPMNFFYKMDSVKNTRLDNIFIIVKKDVTYRIYFD